MIVNKIGDNTFQLDLPPYMEMHYVINAENLKLLDPFMLDEDQG